MKTIEIVNGEINKKTNYLSWECPVKDIELWAQGEFFYNKKTEEYEHEVTDEDGNVLYIVTAK